VGRPGQTAVAQTSNGVHARRCLESAETSATHLAHLDTLASVVRPPSDKNGAISLRNECVGSLEWGIMAAAPPPIPPNPLPPAPGVHREGLCNGKG